jgi:colicin import membrane protein
MVKLVDAPRAKSSGVKASKGKGSGGGKVVVKEETAKPKKAAKKKKTETKAAPKKQPKKAQEVKKSAPKKGTTLVDAEASKKKSSAAKSVGKASQADDAERAYSQALNKIKQKVDNKRKQEEVARIRDKIAGQGSDFPAGAASAGGLGGIPSGQGTVAQLPLNYRLYYQIIEEKIKRNWNLALPPGVMEDMRAMEVVLSITIKADGTITDLSFEKKSGNIYLDDSAFRAVKKSSPLPPFSEYNIREPFFETGIVFPVGELL